MKLQIFKFDLGDVIPANLHNSLPLFNSRVLLIILWRKNLHST